jgi:hypothetical protein
MHEPLTHTRTNDAARCPACQKTLSMASNMTRAMTQCAADADAGPATQAPGPGAGDLTVCAYCSMVCRFLPDLTVCRVSPDEFLALPADLRLLIQHLQATMQAFAVGRRDA